MYESYTNQEIGQFKRAYELLKRVKENSFIVTPMIKKEILELYMSDWERELIEEEGSR